MYQDRSIRTKGKILKANAFPNYATLQEFKSSVPHRSIRVRTDRLKGWTGLYSRCSGAQHPIMRATFLLLCRMTVYSVNDETPNMAMLGCEVLIPATLIAQLPDEPSKPVTPYVTSFRCTLREVHQKIPQNTGTVAKTQKHYFDKYITCSPFHVDQLAWLY